MHALQSITLSVFELTRYLFAPVSLLVAAHGFDFVFQRRGMPRVIGKITGGALLGSISETFFVTLVLVAIITSLVAGSWLRFVLQPAGF